MQTGLKKGLVQIYTGNGKGKTTAAFGLALRASGTGLKVCIYQFAKGRTYGETRAFKRVKGVEVVQCGRSCFIGKKPGRADIECARKGLADSRSSIMSGRYDIFVLDEINIALKLHLIKLADVIDLIKYKPDSVELVLTGRYCPKGLYKYADLVTEMKEVKHPYRLGMSARKGIEF